MVKSKTALWLVGIFIIVTIVIDIYALTCSGMFCGLSAAFLGMPWIFIPLSFLNNDQFFSLIVYQAINAVVIYFLGVIVSKVIGTTIRKVT